MCSKFHRAVAVAVASTAALAFAQSANDARMNQVQVLGSHNSYHAGIDPELFTFLRQKYGDRMDGLFYSHLPIEKQLDMGLRSLEIDVVADPRGGLYAHRPGWRWKSKTTFPPPHTIPKA